MPVFNGTPGADTINGTDENDTVVAGDGNDIIRTRDGRDQVFAGAGDDTIVTGAGDDDIFGGDGDDLIEGGDGGDIINGGAGADTMSGGAGRDVFYNVNVGDVIDGGEGEGDDFDRINLDDAVPEGGSYVIERDADNRENGTVRIFDDTGAETGQIDFTNIEKVVPCFTPGTLIATPRGERAVETLRPGDQVVTRDNGLQTIRWVGRKDMTAADFAGRRHLCPVRIRAGALGNDQPERDMTVSPNHRMLVSNDKTLLYFEEREVLVAAKHLTGLQGVDVVENVDTSYIHIMFDQHEVILSDGTWSESFQPGVHSLAGIGNAQRQELHELFPELATHEGVAKYAAARQSAKRHEALLIVK
ncbi:Hint domain-containing protein [Sulfitobacter sp. S190]|uniref:Hint domain-containing protein n=1 Tax=Sulfitobacter sp. S190 TaxID=2867022 RepID=UPI0021A53011|nr:Hint domain-containing protein [Sulfitobacter sp. S190]UWR20909.1 Hint domain-containing protein [Sulfitobacter sp. S190]